MRADVIRTYKTVHTWTGIVTGMFLFVAFYAGAIPLSALGPWAGQSANFVAADLAAADLAADLAMETAVAATAFAMAAGMAALAKAAARRARQGPGDSVWSRQAVE